MAQPIKHIDRAAGRVLGSLGLPADLVVLVRRGTLQREVRRAYKLLDELNEQYDSFEASNPELAARLPWAKAREEWKRAGRPRPPWWEALRVTERNERVQALERCNPLEWPHPPGKHERALKSMYAANKRYQASPKGKAWFAAYAARKKGQPRA